MNLNVVSSVDGDDFQIMPTVDISVAVATNEGLITPIVKDVPSLTLPEISSTIKDLALRARNGQLKLDEFQVIIMYLIANDMIFFPSIRYDRSNVIFLYFTFLGWNIYYF